MLAAIEQQTIPAAPGPAAERWCCACGNMLGLVCGRFLFSRHKGRDVTAALPARVQCDRCGKKNVKQADA